MLTKRAFLNRDNQSAFIYRALCTPKNAVQVHKSKEKISFTKKYNKAKRK